MAIIPNHTVTKTILTDACTKGIGAIDGLRAYALELHPPVTERYPISEIKGCNVLVACHQFIERSDVGSTVLVKCDNNHAVQVITTGRGQNGVLFDTARKLWFLQATININIRFEHIQGAEKTHS